jgi:hypothetical protein
MGLKELYESWTFKSVTPLSTSQNAREQSKGNVAVDFLPNTYQAEVRNTARNQPVLPSSGDDTTNGTFKPSTAFKYYSTLVSGPLKSFKSRVVHLYNAQGTNKNDRYVSSDKVRNTPGALYSTNS